MKIKHIVVLFAAFISNLAIADSLKSESDIKSFADNLMTKIAKGDMTSAFNMMKPYVIIPEAEFQSAALNSKAQRDQFGVRYGRTIGYEYIGQKKIGESLVRFVYIEKTEKHVLPWMFYFYKAPAGWVLNSFFWNDQMPQLFVTER